MKRVTTNDLEKQIVFHTLGSFMTLSGHVKFDCDTGSIIAFCDEAMRTLDTYRATNNDVIAMRHHALVLFAQAFTYLNEN